MGVALRLAQEADFCEHGTETSRSIKDAFLDQLCDY
jgi:hypothetical protein